MFRSLLVPLDGSRFAEAALPLALRLALAEHAQLRLLLAHQPSAAVVGAGEMSVPSPALDLVLKAREESYLADTAERLGEAPFHGAKPTGLRAQPCATRPSAWAPI